MSAQRCDVSKIQDEDVLRKMWQETEDFGRKKEIRAHMYKIREARLRDFYNTGEVRTDIQRTHSSPGLRDQRKQAETTHHADSLLDHSFLSLKSKEIRDSESPTRDISYKIDTNKGWNIKESNERSHDGKTVTSSRVASKAGSQNIDGGVANYAAKAEQKHSVFQDGDENNFKKAATSSSTSGIKTEAHGGDDNSKFFSSSTSTSSSSRYVSEQRSQQPEQVVRHVTSGPQQVVRHVTEQRSPQQVVYKTSNIPEEFKKHPSYVEGKTKVFTETKTLPDGSTVTTTRYETIGGAKSSQSYSTTTKQVSSGSNEQKFSTNRKQIEYSPEQVCQQTIRKDQQRQDVVRKDQQQRQETTRKEEQHHETRRSEQHLRENRQQTIRKDEQQHETVRRDQHQETIRRDQHQDQQIFKNQDLKIDNKNEITRNQQVTKNVVQKEQQEVRNVEHVERREQHETYDVNRRQVEEINRKQVEQGKQVKTVDQKAKTVDQQAKTLVDQRTTNVEQQRVVEHQTKNIDQVDRRDQNVCHEITIKTQPKTVVTTKTVDINNDFINTEKQHLRDTTKPQPQQQPKEIRPQPQQQQQPKEARPQPQQQPQEARPQPQQQPKEERPQPQQQPKETRPQQPQQQVKPDQASPQKYEQPERRQPIAPPKSELETKTKPTDGQYSTTYRSEFTNKKIAVDVSPTHDAFARSLRSVTPERICKSPTRSLRTSTSSLRSSSSPEKKRPSPARASSPKKPSSIDSSTLTRRPKAPRSRSSSPTDTVSDFEFHASHKIITDLDEPVRPNNLNLTPRKTKKVTERSPTSPLTPTRDTPRRSSLKSSPIRRPSPEKVLRRTDTYEERCRQILGITPRKPSIPDAAKSPKSPTKDFYSPSRPQDQRSPTKEASPRFPKESSPRSPTKDSPRSSSPRKSPQEFPSQIRRSPERRPLEPYPQRKSPGKDSPQLQEFPSQIRRSPERRSQEPYPQRKSPSKDAPQLGEFPSQRKGHPESPTRGMPSIMCHICVKIKETNSARKCPYHQEPSEAPKKAPVQFGKSPEPSPTKEIPSRATCEFCFIRKETNSARKCPYHLEPLETRRTSEPSRKSPESQIQSINCEFCLIRKQNNSARKCPYHPEPIETTRMTIEEIRKTTESTSSTCEFCLIRKQNNSARKCPYHLEPSEVSRTTPEDTKKITETINCEFCVRRKETSTARRCPYHEEFTDATPKDSTPKPKNATPSSIPSTIQGSPSLINCEFCIRRKISKFTSKKCPYHEIPASINCEFCIIRKESRFTSKKCPYHEEPESEDEPEEETPRASPCKESSPNLSSIIKKGYEEISTEVYEQHTLVEHELRKLHENRRSESLEKTPRESPERRMPTDERGPFRESPERPRGSPKESPQRRTPETDAPLDRRTPERESTTRATPDREFPAVAPRRTPERETPTRPSYAQITSKTHEDKQSSSINKQSTITTEQSTYKQPKTVEEIITIEERTSKRTQQPTSKTIEETTVGSKTTTAEFIDVEQTTCSLDRTTKPKQPKQHPQQQPITSVEEVTTTTLEERTSGLHKTQKSPDKKEPKQQPATDTSSWPRSPKKQTTTKVVDEITTIEERTSSLPRTPKVKQQPTKATTEVTTKQKSKTTVEDFITVEQTTSSLEQAINLQTTNLERTTKSPEKKEPKKQRPTEEVVTIEEFVCTLPQTKRPKEEPKQRPKTTVITEALHTVQQQHHSTRQEETQAVTSEETHITHQTERFDRSEPKKPKQPLKNKEQETIVTEETIVTSKSKPQKRPSGVDVEEIISIEEISSLRRTDDIQICDDTIAKSGPKSGPLQPQESKAPKFEPKLEQKRPEDQRKPKQEQKPKTPEKEPLKTKPGKTYSQEIISKIDDETTKQILEQISLIDEAVCSIDEPKEPRKQQPRKQEPGKQQPRREPKTTMIENLSKERIDKIANEVITEIFDVELKKSSVPKEERKPTKSRPQLGKEPSTDEIIAHAISFSRGDRVQLVEEPEMVYKKMFEVRDDEDEITRVTKEFIINEQIDLEINKNQIKPIRGIPDVETTKTKTTKKDFSKKTEEFLTQEKVEISSKKPQAKYPGIDKHKPVGKSVDRPREKPVDKPRDKSVDKPKQQDKPKERPKETVERPLSKSFDKPRDKSVDKPSKVQDKPKYQDKPRDKSVDKFVSKPSDRCLGKHRDKSVDKPADKPKGKPQDASPSKPRDKSVDKPLIKSTDRPRLVDKPTKAPIKTVITTCKFNIKDTRTVRLNGEVKQPLKPSQPKIRPRDEVKKPREDVKKTEVKKRVVSTTINLAKPKPKSAPKSKAKPIQNGHTYSEDEEDEEIKSIDQPKCISTKSIIIQQTVADEREIIVGLQRSKSSREETPDRENAWPITTEEDSGIPRYPDQILEPEEPMKPTRIRDIPLNEDEDVTEFGRISEMVDTKITEVDRVQETDDCLLTVNEKVSKFLHTADNLTKQPKKGVAPKVQRPKLDIEENLKTDECLLSVSDKVSKFITTAEKLSVSDIPERPKSPRCKYFVEETEEDEEKTKDCGALITKFIATTEQLTKKPEDKHPELIKEKSPELQREKSPVKKVPERKSPGRKSPEKTPHVKIEEEVVTPKSSKPIPERTTTRLRSTETIKKARALFENIEKEEKPKQKDILSRPSVFEARRLQNVRKTLNYDEPEDKDSPHYMKQLDRTLRPKSPHKETCINEEIDRKEEIHTREETRDIPHYMTQLDRTPREKSPHYIPRPHEEEEEIRSSTPIEENIPHYMTQLDRTLRAKSPHKENVAELEELAKGHVPHQIEDVKPTKFGVVLRRTDSDRSERRRSSTVTTDVDGAKKELEIEEIYELDLLESMLEKVVGYEFRRRIRAQIRIVKKLISENKLHKVTKVRKTPDLIHETITIRKVGKAPSPARKMPESPYGSTTRRYETTTRHESSIKQESTTKPYESTFRPFDRKSPESITRSPKSPTRASPTRKASTPETIYKSKPYESPARKSSPTRNEEPSVCSRSEVHESSYAYTERRSSQVKLEERRSSQVKLEERRSEERKSSRAKSPKKPEEKIFGKSPDFKPFKSSAESTKVTLKKIAPISKTIPSDKPEWATQKVLKKASDRSPITTKKVVSATTTTKEAKRVSPGKDLKPTDVITSSYGVGPTDENGSPLFGLRALRAQNKNEKTKVQGTVMHSSFYSENGQEPVGEISVTKYSTDPKDLGSNEDLECQGDLLSKTTTQKFGYKDTPAYKSITDRKKNTNKSETRTSSTTKVTRRGSVKEMSQKFLDSAVETLKSERQSSYPKAGLILRTSSFKDPNQSGSSREGSPPATSDTHKTMTVRTSSSTSSATGQADTFLTNTSKVTGVQDVISRMKTEEIREGDTAEDVEARNLLNKFLGSQVILAGMEGSMKSSSSRTMQEVSASATASTETTGSMKRTTKITTTITENGIPKTTTTTYTHPITPDVLEGIWEEQTLRLLLEQSTEYEERRIIRARLKQVMAEKEACSEFVEKTIEENQTGNVQERVETTRKTFTEGPLTTTQVSTRVTSQQQITKKPMSPFAKFRQLDKQNSVNTPPRKHPNKSKHYHHHTPKTPTSGGPMFKFTDPNLSRSASTIKERLLQWCQMKTKEYENIKLDNFSTSWADGLAFCALVHHFLPDAFDYHKLTPNNRRYNFTLAFQVADEKADIAPLLDVDDMVATRRPDWKCVFTYVQSIYRRFKDED